MRKRLIEGQQRFDTKVEGASVDIDEFQTGQEEQQNSVNSGYWWMLSFDPVVVKAIPTGGTSALYAKKLCKK